LSRWSQFVALVFGHLGERHSLRDIEAAFRSQPKVKYHLAMGSISKSALSRANEKYDPEFFQELFGLLYQRCQKLPTLPGKSFRFPGKLFSLDGSLIDLSMKVFPWADVAPKKAAFKLHVGLDHEGFLPAFAAVTEGLESEMMVADRFAFPEGSVLVFDRGYSRYGWHKALSDRGLFWVTRPRSNMLYEVLDSYSVEENSAVIRDELIRFTSARAQKEDLDPVRRVEYWDAESKKRYVFTTNQLAWSAQTIADIYKSRWEVELFFKWIKQNLKIKTFLGHTLYAVATQVYVALCLYLLLAFLKFKSRSAYGAQAILRLLRMNLFLRLPIEQLLVKPKPPPPQPQKPLSLRFA
jgi:putative transposase